MSGTNESTNNACVVCYKNVEIYSIGMCEHPVCYECSTRMRVLCCQNECPICRQDVPKVVFTKEIKPFHCLSMGSLLDTRYNIYFSSLDIQEKFTELLVNVCSVCTKKPMFSSFNILKDHMRQEHELHYCELCVENLKIFSYERRCYTRSNLAQHRRKGDADDKSHKGHPLCEFCDQRYMDNDELYRHLRRDHLYCHFCDADGLHQYYSSYDYLRDHFRQEHFLCEEGVCVEEKFTSVFRSDIDLKAHKATVHVKELGKAAAKQARTLELQVTLTPRSENRLIRRGVLNTLPTSSLGGEWHPVPPPIVCGFNSFETKKKTTFIRELPSLDVQSTDEFPTLGNSAPVVPTLPQSKGRGNVTIRSTLRAQPLAVTDENFPALGPESAGPSISKTMNFSVSSSNTLGSNVPQYQKGSTSNVSIQVNHESNGTVTTRVSGPNIKIRPTKLSIESDFPALHNSEPSTSSTAANPAQWKEVVQWTCSKSTPTNVPKSKKVVPAPSTSLPIQSGEDFPSLSKPSKSKKQSVITVVPSWGQNSQNSSNNQNAKTTEPIKGKTKKKKVKQNSNSNNSSGNESSGSKSNASTTVTKKDVELARNSNDCRISKEDIQVTDVTNNETNNKNFSKSLNIQNSKETDHTNKKEKKRNKNAEGNSCATVLNTESGSNSTNEMQKKRSELKIDNLNRANNNVYQMEDFPTLGSTSARPPGFTNPPPGFSSATPPPPGFSIKYNNMEKLHGSNGLTFTNSSGESYSILPDSSKHRNQVHTYVPPPDFQKRNKCLVARFNEVLGQQGQIEEFRYVSGLFRGGTCDAQEYYAHCRTIMGASVFENVFPELLVLLPDIVKQQELFKVHKKETGGKVKGLETCATCSQVLKNGPDFNTHMSSHMLENHFPALGKNNIPPPKNTWVRK